MRIIWMIVSEDHCNYYSYFYINPRVTLRYTFVTPRDQIEEYNTTAPDGKRGGTPGDACGM